MSRIGRALSGGAIAVGLGVVLSGCTMGPDFEIFDREPEAADALPDAVSGEMLRPDTARFAGDDDGTSLWLVRPAAGDGICLVAYRSDDAWIAGCSDDGDWVRIGGEPGTYEVARDGSPAPAGTVPLFDNVFVPADDAD